MTRTPTQIDLASLVVRAVRSVVGPGIVELHEPRFNGHEWQYVKECLDSTFVSSVGAFVGRFEADLAAYTGARHVVAVVNGTAALQVALRVAGVMPGDEVLVPALSFVASASAIVHAGATPHFVDSHEATLGLDPGAVRDYLSGATDMRGGMCVNRATGRVIRAVVPMHTFGHPVEIEGVLSLARDFNLAVVEDAAESLGTTTQGRHTGTFGVAGVLSFNGNKTITTGGGGAILTNDATVARLARHLTTTARVSHPWSYVHDEIGYNYRLPNLNAALGCAQLEQLPALVEAKRLLFERYTAAFCSLPQVRLFAEPAGARSNYWLQTLLLHETSVGQRDQILAASHEAGLKIRPAWTLTHRLTPYLGFPRMAVPAAESLERRIINLPSSPHLAARAAL